MKHSILTLFILSVLSIHAQDTIEVEPPVIVAKLLLGTQYNYNNITVKFVDVINDSRCPKGVNCVRAGEAKVLVALYMDDKLLEEKIIEITPTTYLVDSPPQLIGFGETTIKGFNLTPYPEWGKEIKKEDYTFQIVVGN